MHVCCGHSQNHSVGIGLRRLLTVLVLVKMIFNSPLHYIEILQTGAREMAHWASMRSASRRT